MDNRPIGVFDSGLGGLTGVRELRKRLPHEEIIYFGDTGRVPYGSRSPETIRLQKRQSCRCPIWAWWMLPPGKQPLLPATAASA